MKRPLFTACFAAVCIMYVYMHFFPPDVRVFTGLPMGESVWQGRVYNKEYRAVNNSTNLILYLSVISSPASYQGDIPIHKMICYMKGNKEPPMGSIISLAGIAEAFPVRTNPGEFDAAGYYAAKGLDIRLTRGVLLSVESGGNPVSEGMWRFGRILSERLYSNLPEEEANVMQAMLLGNKGSLDADTKKLYKRNGIIHILAISGLHISILGIGSYKLLRKTGMLILPAAVIAACIMLLYGCLTGFSVSVLRAVGMFLLHMLAECVGRTYDMLTALGILALVLALSQPLYLYQSGYLLSFGSVLGIGVLYPALSGGKKGRARYLEGIRKLAHSGKEKIRKALIAGLSITLMTLPVHVWYYYEIPIYGMLLNLAVLPLMSVLMPAGLYVMLMPSKVLALPGTMLIGGILTLYDALCRISEKIPFHTAVTGVPHIWQTAAYILLLGTVIFIHNTKYGRKGVKWLILTAGVSILMLRVQTDLKVTFLDVGQGDGICLQAGASEAYLIDGGSSSKKELGEYQLLPFLKHEGISSLNAVFITHPDEDHMSGIRQILEEEICSVKIERIIVPDAVHLRKNAGFETLLSLASQKGIPVETIYKGNAWQQGKLKVTCLHPPEDYEGEDTNAYSQVLYMQYGSFSMLLTGDVEGEGEQLLQKEIQKRGIRDITVLKAAHHGSANGSTKELIEYLNPVISVISCGKNNQYGHPSEEVLQRLKATGTQIYVTARSGAITVRTDGRRVRLQEFNTVRQQ